MTNIHTNKWFWIGVAVVILIAIAIYQLNKVPNSFDMETSSLLGLGNTKVHYEKRNGKYYKKVTSSVAGNSSVGVEVEITKEDYLSAYKQYQSEA